MSTLLHYIGTRIGEENLIDNNRKSLSRDRCRVDLTGVPPDLIIVDMDAVFPSGQEGRKICDYVIFLYERSQNTYVVVPIEVKSGAVDASEVSKQLKGGATFANPFVPQDKGFTIACCPILFHSRGIRTAEVRELNSNRSKVRFRGGTFEIKTSRCGAPNNLADALYG